MWITLKKREKAGCLFFLFYLLSLDGNSNHTRSLEWQGNLSHNYVHKMPTDFLILNQFAVICHLLVNRNGEHKHPVGDTH